jgi:YVTN family beta-propeller protein
VTDWWKRAGANALTAVNTASGQLVAVTTLSSPPGAVSAADGSLWVADPTTGQVSRIDPATGTEVAQIPVGGEPGPMASGGGAIWVADTSSGTVTRIDPARNSVAQTITLPWTHPSAIAFGVGRVWVADPAARQLAEINPVTGSLQRTLAVDLRPSAIAAASQTVWVTGYDSAIVEQLAPASGYVIAASRNAAATQTRCALGISERVEVSLNVAVISLLRLVRVCLPPRSGSGRAGRARGSH